MLPGFCGPIVRFVPEAYVFVGKTIIGVPNGIRTRVAALKGRCPRPLDDGDETLIRIIEDINSWHGFCKIFFEGI